MLVSRAKLASLGGGDGSEQDRDHRERYNMASYLWTPDSNHILFDSNGRLWLYDLHNGTGVQVGFTGAASGDDPKFSPNGEAISFMRDHGLVVMHLRTVGTPLEVVAGAPIPDILNGEVDWVYAEELEVRSNYFWSPDSKSIAFLQVNETQVPQYPVTDWIPTHARVDLQHYPQPGRPQSGCTRGRGERLRRQDGVDEDPISWGTGLYSTFRLGGPQDGVDRDPDAGPQTSQHFLRRRRQRAIPPGAGTYRRQVSG